MTDPGSGLRDPQAAVRGMGALALGCEALVLLLAIQPIRVLGGNLPGIGIAAVALLAAACLALAGLLRHRWAWTAAAVVPVALVVAGFVFHGSLAVLGVLFGLVWAYVLHVRRRVLG